MDQKPPVLDLYIPGMNFEVEMSIAALVEVSKYVLEHQNDFNVGDHFTLTGTDKKRVKMRLTK